MWAPTNAADYVQHRVARRTALLPVIACAIVLGGLLTASGATAVAAQGGQPAASPAADTIRYPSGTAQIEAYIARPQTAGKHPAVIVVHDDLGLNDPIRAVAQLFARAGFVGFAPNLASRGTGSVAPASGTMGAGSLNRLGLPPIQTVNDLLAAFKFLQQDTGVDASKISAVGVGWGGYRVWKMAQQLPTLHRGVVFYGVTPTEDEVATIKTPMLGHYAQYDFILTASVLKTKKQLGQKFTYHIYPTSRGFFGGGSASSALDMAALAGEVDLHAVEAERKTQKAAPTSGNTGSARVALERTLAFLRN